MMHFEMVDIDALEADPNYFGHFDAFVYGHPSYKDNVVISLIASGKKFFSYHAMFNYHRTDEIGQGDPWIDWWRANLQIGQNARMLSGSLVGLFNAYVNLATCEHREFVDWAKITATWRQNIVNELWFLRPWGGMFFDQSWQTPDEFSFFFCHGGSPLGTCSPCPTGMPESLYTTQASYQASVRDFWDRARLAAGARGTYNLTNGEYRAINGQPMTMPIYLENTGQYPGQIYPAAWYAWLAIWKQHPQNVLSMIVPNAQYFPQMVDEFRVNGGWVALTGPYARTQTMLTHYRQLQAAAGVAQAPPHPELPEG